MKHLFLLLFIGCTAMAQDFMKDKLYVVARSDSKLQVDVDDIFNDPARQQKGDTMPVIGYTQKMFKVITKDGDTAFVKNWYVDTNDVVRSFAKNQEENEERHQIEETCSYSVNETDSFSNKIRKTTERVRVSENDLFISLRRVGNKITVRFLTYADLGCISPYQNNRSSAKLKLKNGDVLNFYHRGDIECGMLEIEANILPSEIKRLKNSELDVVRINGTKYYEDHKEFIFPDYFSKKLECIE